MVVPTAHDALKSYVTCEFSGLHREIYVPRLLSVAPVYSIDARPRRGEQSRIFRDAVCKFTLNPSRYVSPISATCPLFIVFELPGT